MDNANLLLNRWNLDDRYITLQKQVINILKGGKNINKLRVNNELIDIKGIKLNEFTDKEKEVDKVLYIKSNTFINVDFSFADLSNTNWRNCKFIDCKFQHSTFYNVTCKNCTFEDLEFTSCKFKHCELAQNISTDSGKFINVNFIKSSFKYVNFCFPIFDKCLFKDCRIEKVDFDGSRFSDTSFEGVIDSADFRGYSLTSSTGFLGLFKKFDPLKYPNMMRNVDFLKAELKWVGFTHNIDLSNTKFPTGNNYILITNPQKCFSSVKEIIKNTWNTKESSWAINMIDTFWFPENTKDMKFIFLSMTYSARIPKEVDERLFELVKANNN